MELLFGGVKEFDVTLESDPQPRLRDLIAHIKANLLKGKPELFVQGDTVLPGILVLINDSDWELEGGIEYELQDMDNILFISTLHGG
ncbi:ubiquitin-related modifier 1 [Cladochytrium replicatum]|nr:ubiquitin-related modifier 1 [Cladochytrium replicatum]